MSVQAEEQQPKISASAVALQQTARILEGVSDACVVLDRDWNYVYVNAHAGRLFNRHPEQLVGKNIWKEFPEGVDQEFYRTYYRAAETQQFMRLEAYYPPWNRWFENRIYPSADGLVIFFQEVTERRIAERERRQLAKVLEVTGDMVVVSEVGGGVQFANAAAAELIGLEGGALPTHFEDLVAPGALGQLREQAIPAAMRTGCWQGETALRRSSGSEVPVLASLVYEGPADGEAGFLALVARDITQRKHAEDQGRHEAYVRAKAEQMAHFGVWEWDLATNHVQWSDELHRIYGLAGQTFGASLEAYLDRVHPDDRARVRASLDRAMREKSNISFEERIVRPDGATRYLRSWGGIRLAENGEPLGLMGACLDVTELFEATTELRRNQEWLRMALEASAIGLWDWDIARGTIAWSPGAEQLLGVPAGTITGTYDAYLHLIHPDDRASVDAAVKAALKRDDMEYLVLHRVVVPDGSTRWIEGRGRAFSDARGKRVRMAGSVTDVTQRRALEESVRQSQKMEAIGRLAAGVAHDFNNLLTVILSTADLLSQHGALDQSTRAGLEEIVGAAKRASGLTRQLLMLSRQQLPGINPMDLNEIIEASSSMLRRLLPEDVRLTVDLEPGLWPVRGDRGQIEQVLLNLVVNARDAMPTGGEIRIATRNAPKGALPRHDTGPQISLSISDTGTGMTPEVRARVFEPFFTTKPAGKGTGLGLAMVYGIVSQLGGAIDLETAPGRGTTLTLAIPAQPSAPRRAAPAPSAQSSRGVGETVLLVDDQDAIRRTLGSLLKAIGYRVVEAHDGEAALKALDAPETGPVDVLLTDIGMPLMNGVELARRVRSAHPEVGVVFMSGYSDGVIADLTSERTASIIKPFTSAEISAVLRSVLPESVHAG